MPEQSHAPDLPEFPALSDDEIHKSLDDIATLLASQSNRMDEQTTALNRLREVATEARQAAFAAQEQTDPELYADVAVTLMEERTGKIVNQMESVTNQLSAALHQANIGVLEMGTTHAEALQRILKGQEKVERARRRLIWFSVGVLVLAVAMAIMLPRAVTSYEVACELLGGLWNTTSRGSAACAFYSR